MKKLMPSEETGQVQLQFSVGVNSHGCQKETWTFESIPDHAAHIFEYFRWDRCCAQPE